MSRRPASSRGSSLLLVFLYAKKESPKFERAAIRWLEPYLAEGSPSLRDFAMAAGPLA